MNIKHAFRTILVCKVSVLFFIFVDDMRTQLWCYGNFQMKTPHLPFNAYTEWYDREQNLQSNMLYDHERDPSENVNLYGEPEYEELILEMREDLLETWPELKKNP